MKLHYMLLTMATVGLVFAQPPGGPDHQAGPPPRHQQGPRQQGPQSGPMMPPMGMAQPKFDNIKAYLGLTDANLQAIKQAIQKNQGNLASLHEQLEAKQKVVSTLLESGSTESAVIGKAVLEANAIRKQIKTQAESVKAAVVSNLTDAQKTKLAALEEAAKLRPAIQEAGGLFLLALAPEGGPGMMGGPGMGGPRGPVGPGGPGMHRMGPGGQGGPGGPGGDRPRRGGPGEEEEE